MTDQPTDPPTDQPTDGQSRFYYLGNKNVSAHFNQSLLNNLFKYNKIGGKIKALQISKQAAQTASLWLF